MGRMLWLLGLVVLSTALAADDLSKHEVLNVYLLGTEPPDMVTVAEAINKLARADLNATVRWTFLGWDKWEQKYNLALASGEPVSLVYTANWANYQSYARKGAFQPLDDVVAKTAPDLWTSLTPAQWNQARVGGKVYTVPTDWKEYQTNSIEYRADVAERLGFSRPLQSVADLEQFLLAAKRADPTSIPYGATYEDLMQIQDAFLGPFDQVIRGTFLGYYVVADQGGKLVNWYETPRFLAYAETMKRWHDAGFWSRDILSNKVNSEEYFKEGKNLAASGNPSKADALFRSVTGSHPSWKLGSFVYAQALGRVFPNPSIGNGMALPRSCPNPERALKLLEKLRTDSRYYRLTSWGVQNVHYRLDAEGQALTVPDSGFWYDAMQPWGWHSDRLEMPAAGRWPGLAPLTAALDRIATDNRFSVFAFDAAPVASQISALNQVANQYLLPLFAGAVPDLPAAVRSLNARLQAAGLDQLKAEMQKQVSAYLAARP